MQRVERLEPELVMMIMMMMMTLRTKMMITRWWWWRSCRLSRCRGWRGWRLSWGGSRSDWGPCSATSLHLLWATRYQLSKGQHVCLFVFFSFSLHYLVYTILSSSNTIFVCLWTKLPKIIFNGKNWLLELNICPHSGGIKSNHCQQKKLIVLNNLTQRVGSYKYQKLWHTSEKERKMGTMLPSVSAEPPGVATST